MGVLAWGSRDRGAPGHRSALRGVDDSRRGFLRMPLTWSLFTLLLSVLQPSAAVREPACPGQYGAFDQFGVAELNATKKGGREWFIDPPNFSTDPHVTYSSHTGNAPVLMCDDSIQSDELGDAGFEGVRIQIGTLWDAGEVAWNQTEMTAYIFLENYSPSVDTMWRLDLYSKS